MTTLAAAAPAWTAPPADVRIGDREVHAWRLPLTPSEPRLEAMLDTLSAGQRARAARFHFERDRRRYVASEGLMREILARYLGVAPAEIRFEYGRRGKPALARAPWLRFNLSRSHELALLGVTRSREIGVDVERVRDLGDWELIAKHFFAEAERQALAGLPPDLRIPGFFNCWTRKEAYVKAVGDGLYQALDSFTVSLAPEQPARLVSVADDPAETARWRVEHVRPEPGYVGALFVEGWDWELACWSASPVAR